MPSPTYHTSFWIRLIGRLPLRPTCRLVSRLARLSTYLPLSLHSAYRTALVNLLICYPDKTLAEVRQLARDSIGELAWTLIDCAHCWTHPASTSLKRIRQIHGLDALQEAMASPRPVLLLSLHLSSWELPNLVVGQQGAATVFYQPTEDVALNDLVTSAREATGCQLVTAGPSGVKAALGAMKRGEAVAILADHNPANRKGNPWASFLGQPVSTSNLPFKLHQRFSPRIFFAGARRVDGQVHAHFVEACADLYAETDEVATLEKMNQGLADLIAPAPEQYQWTYKRFHRTPEGRRPLYKKQLLSLLKKLPHLAERDSCGLGRYSAETTETLCKRSR